MPQTPCFKVTDCSKPLSALPLMKKALVHQEDSAAHGELWFMCSFTVTLLWYQSSPSWRKRLFDICLPISRLSGNISKDSRILCCRSFFWKLFLMHCGNYLNDEKKANVTTDVTVSWCRCDSGAYLKKKNHELTEFWNEILLSWLSLLIQNQNKHSFHSNWNDLFKF